MFFVRMNIPAPPNDPEQRNIIDKLADFVARNGKEFEALTRDKQRGNPKFAFLHGGEYFDYYNFKVDDARKHWQTDRSHTDGQSQGFDGGFQWAGPAHDSGEFHWEPYGGVAEADYPQPYSMSGPCHWSRDSEAPWYLLPSWPGGPSFSGAPRAPAGPPGFGPPLPNFSMNDGFRGRGYGAPQSYGYQGPSNQGGPYPPPRFPFQGGHFNDCQPPGNSGPNSVSEFSEADVEQSEKNLKAQRDVLMARQASEIAEFMDHALMNSVKERCARLNLRIEQLDEVIQPLIDSCTKENISRGKTWVIEKGSESMEAAELVADYLLARAAVHNVSFDLRLHLIYLLNDLLHHFKRRGVPNCLQETIQRIVPPMFCLTSELADEDKKSKLSRVLDLWDSNAYLPASMLEEMKPPKMDSFLSGWKESQKKAHEADIGKIKREIESQYASLELQHKEFSAHVHRQISATQHDIRPEHFEPPQPPMQASGPGYGNWGPPGPHPMSPYDSGESEMGEPPRRMHQGNYFGPPRGGGSGYAPGFPPCGGGGWSGNNRGPPPNWGPPPFQMGRPPFLPPHGYGASGSHREHSESSVYIEDDDLERSYDGPYDPGYDNQYDNFHRHDDRGRSESRSERSFHHRSSRPSRFSSSRHDLSRDDPDDHRPRSSRASHSSNGSDRADVSQEKPIDPADLIPKCPPWELPAGLIHPLIRLCDFEYSSLDESKLRLLPPKAPSERLLQAIENFYLPPSHDRTRDGEGWERLGLYEFYSKKEKARDYLQRRKKRKKRRSGTVGEIQHSRATSDSRRRRRNSGGSGIASSSGDDSQGESNPDVDCEHMRPFTRDSSHGMSSRPTAFHLSHITAYPTAAIGQGVRTGPEALAQLLPSLQLAHTYPGYKAAGSVGGQSGVSIPPPRQSSGTVIPGIPPGFPAPGFLQFPPPSMSQPPPSVPQGLIQRPISEGDSTTSRAHSDTRRSRSKSRSFSRSRSGSPYSRSRSRSRSCTPRSRSLSGSRASRSRSRSQSAHSTRVGGDGGTNTSEHKSRDKRRKRSRSRSDSGSPITRFTSAPSPSGFTSGSGDKCSAGLCAARAAAMAAAASIASSINVNKCGGAVPSTWPGGSEPPSSFRADSNKSGVQASSFDTSCPPIKTNRIGSLGRSRFSSAVVNPNRVAEMHLLGAGPDERFPPSHQPPPS